MERKGGCCLAPRYGAAGPAAAQQQAGASWQMGRIMLKFRPIAPKPAAMAPVPAPTPVVAGPSVGAAGRGKRKAVCGAGGGRRGRKPKKAAAVVTAAPALAAAAAQDAGDCKKDCEKEKSSSSRSSSSSGMTSVDSSPPPPQHHLPTLLPLMPVTAVEDKGPAAGAATEELPAPVPSQVAAAATGSARPFAPRALRPGSAAWAASLVTVEEVTATWRDGEAPPSSAACVADDAPAFVSDQWGRVTWRNAAFVRAVPADDGGDEVETQTPVALSGALPAWGTCSGFTCRVRWHSSPRRVGSTSSVVAPCDVWRLDAGGSYLWRLDLQAALTLGGRL
ncbi:hypothetical protein BDA96_08G093900 [Sorghum bicolor]|uniref:DUF7950 domain-containing protein n=1 Tax=Sorghum bicolor TaxID=4558 RepID=A0A921QES3_SORBI|nr:hypothetical protein BDA96_08G093900 [Sorghum bicolor]